VHPPELKAEALRLFALGLNDCEISRRIGIPRPTIRDWRCPPYIPTTPLIHCPRCGQRMKPIRFSVADYSELFGMYLGDGCISASPRTSRLRISLDAKYPRIIEDGRLLLERFFPENRVDIVPFHKSAGVDLSVYNKHLPCLFPQAGPGLKHLRPIRPEIWQWAIIAAEPWPFIRGCIRTDGCVFVNRTGKYEYLTYHFANMSRDIAQLFTFALKRAGVEYRHTSGCKRGIHNVRVNRRASVLEMLGHIGVKA
jgi:hypothetical protein